MTIPVDGSLSICNFCFFYRSPSFPAPPPVSGRDAAPVLATCGENRKKTQLCPQFYAPLFFSPSIPAGADMSPPNGTLPMVIVFSERQRALTLDNGW